MHHTQYIEALLAEGQIKVKAQRRRQRYPSTIRATWAVTTTNTTRRATMATATGMKLVEMEKSKAPGHVLRRWRRAVWMEDEGDTRINYNRLAQIQATGCQEVGVACPFCMVMLEDAKGAKGAEDLVVRDVAEIVADGLVAE